MTEIVRFKTYNEIWISSYKTVKPIPAKVIPISLRPSSLLASYSLLIIIQYVPVQRHEPYFSGCRWLLSVLSVLLFGVLHFYLSGSCRNCLNVDNFKYRPFYSWLYDMGVFSLFQAVRWQICACCLDKVG